MVIFFDGNDAEAAQKLAEKRPKASREAAKSQTKAGREAATS
jgi:hypothetical protein